MNCPIYLVRDKPIFDLTLMRLETSEFSSAGLGSILGLTLDKHQHPDPEHQGDNNTQTAGLTA